MGRALRRTRGRTVDVTGTPELDRRLAAGAGSLAGWRVHEADLRGRTDGLLALDLAGATFLGCAVDPSDVGRLEAAGALLLPDPDTVPVEVHRAELYSPDELLDAPSWTGSLDGRAYAWSQRADDEPSRLARALHDHAIDEALDRWREGRRLVGVMGGHAARRGEEAYAEAARLGRLLAGPADPDGDGLVVATGGGPGAMEAANLGARLCAQEPAALDRALEVLAQAPGFRPSVDRWLEPAREVARWGHPVASLGVPTWHYGHEPPNAFATAVAKYFRNATREAVLLEVCDAGIVFLPGAAGTVQEVFQDACENYYADASSLAPMVLLGRRFWTEELPVWPLLHALARDRAMATRVHLVDTAEEAAAVIRQPR